MTTSDLIAAHLEYDLADLPHATPDQWESLARLAGMIGSIARAYADFPELARYDARLTVGESA